MVNNNQLAIQRTKFANQRTYLSYMRTGFSIASLAGIFKKKYILYFGLIMIVLSAIQYKLIVDGLNEETYIRSFVLDNAPLIYIPLSLIVIYLQFYKKNKFLGF